MEDEEDRHRWEEWATTDGPIRLPEGMKCVDNVMIPVLPAGSSLQNPIVVDD